MTMPVERQAFWQIHFCIFLWGLTAIFGKLISLPAHSLVTWRMLMVALTLAVVWRTWLQIATLSKKILLIHALIGVLVAIHWLAFYGSIKLANASVAVTTVAFGSFFAALIEPYMLGRRFDLRELLLGLLVVPGVVLLVGGVPLSMHLGIAVGIFSALVSAAFSVLNKRYIHEAPANTATLIQMSVGGVFLIIISAVTWGVEATFTLPSWRDFQLLVILVVACTLLPYLLYLRSLRHISAFAAQLALNLEPVYAIILAALMLAEYQELSVQFYIGVLIILSAVFIQPLIKVVRNKRVASEQLSQ